MSFPVKKVCKKGIHIMNKENYSAREFQNK